MKKQNKLEKTTSPSLVISAKPVKPKNVVLFCKSLEFYNLNIISVV